MESAARQEMYLSTRLLVTRLGSLGARMRKGWAKKLGGGERERLLKLQRRLQQLNLIVRNNSISYECYQQISGLHEVVWRGWRGETDILLLTLLSLTFHHNNSKLFNISVKRCSFLQLKLAD